MIQQSVKLLKSDCPERSERKITSSISNQTSITVIDAVNELHSNQTIECGDQGWCVGKVILHDGSTIADRHAQGAVSVGKGEHNHALITDSSVLASVFPQAMSLDKKQVKTVASMLMAGSSASNVVDAMREDQGKTLKPKDVVVSRYNE
ncbi:hypothetical protein [Absidia glauca]|uniref:Uncharacterized protein n=1 Tax=Absidia glauca TaxID=4829 RepID=A0A168PTU7_ABSGL|nr:hypothetical protein [Absidia glauca]